ncbi:MAG: hypothetical protein ACI901_000314 [Octadecabacter sp.]|jgi:hypothetical protein
MMKLAKKITDGYGLVDNGAQIKFEFTTSFKHKFLKF